MTQRHPAQPARRPSPAVSFVGRQNSGKTTLLERVIRTLSSDGLKVASIKHHGHPDFSIDVPGKDSWRHREAGAHATAVLSEQRFALTRNLDAEMTCHDALALMPGYDIVVVEGFRGVGLPTVELFRAANPKDQAALPQMLARLHEAAGGHEQDDTGPVRVADEAPLPPKATTAHVHPAALCSHRESPNSPALPAALVTDVPELTEAARAAHVPAYSFNDIDDLAAFVKHRYARAPLTIAVQAGGASRRMGQSKARMPFLGRPLIEHMLDLVADFADELVVTTNEQTELTYLAHLYPGIKIEHDLLPERGALPGLLTALHHSDNDLVGVVACDMIAFPPKILALEAIALQARGANAAAPFHNGCWEPFAGVYRRSACEPELHRLLAQGSKRMQDLLDAVDCLPFDSAPFQRPGRIDPFANANTPDELAQAETLYRLYD